MTTLYLRADRSIGRYVLLSGDPWRVDTLANMLEDAKHIAFSREFNTYTGTYKGTPITVSSTGIGSPSAAIAMEELFECGMEVAVRMGTVMALADEDLGKFIIPIGSMREDHTSNSYAPIGYPAVADMDLVRCMNTSVESLGGQYRNGINCSVDGFYTTMKDSKLARRQGTDFDAGFDRLRSLNVLGLDMESSCVLTLARLMGVKACVVTLATVLAGLKSQLIGQVREQAEQNLCRVALEGIYLFDKKGL